MKKIERIILFGDSFIQGTGCWQRIESDGRMIYDYSRYDDLRSIELRKYHNKESWGDNLKKYFPNVEVHNYGYDGFSNYESFEKLCHYMKHEHKKSDLILFGFTSKFRDFSLSQKFVWNTHPGLLNSDNPLYANPLAWQKEDYHLNHNYFALNSYHYDEDIRKEEQQITKDFILDYTTHLHNDIHLEYNAKVNYMFLQHWVKKYDLNFHCFDLFENYVVGNIGNFKIDTEIYFDYSNHRNQSMLYYLKNHEREHFEQDDRPFVVSYFEDNQSFLNLNGIEPTQVIHPNQIGYGLYVDYLCQNFLLKKYK